MIGRSWPDPARCLEYRDCIYTVPVIEAGADDDSTSVSDDAASCTHERPHALSATWRRMRTGCGASTSGAARAGQAGPCEEGGPTVTAHVLRRGT